MDEELFELEILSPEKLLFSGLVELVMLPGVKAPFTVLYNHAPLVSTLCAGKIKWKNGKNSGVMAIGSGFVEVKDNKVTALIEVKGEC
jgi:F-type H+-transporting ATPase subunit epsilon